MITRIVKMTFEPDSVPEFLAIFEASKHLIRNSKGCTQLDLLNDAADKTIFFTYSVWESEAHLLRGGNQGLNVLDGPAQDRRIQDRVRPKVFHQNYDRSGEV